MAFVFQQYSLYPNYSVRESRVPAQVEAPSDFRGRDSFAASRRRPDVAVSPICGSAYRPAVGRRDAAGGDRPGNGTWKLRLFLMDEPLSNLDAKLRELLRSELQELQLRLGATLISPPTIRLRP